MYLNRGELSLCVRHWHKLKNLTEKRTNLLHNGVSFVRLDWIFFVTNTLAYFVQALHFRSSGKGLVVKTCTVDALPERYAINIFTNVSNPVP